MSLDLSARLRLIDDMTRPLRSATSGLLGFSTKVLGVSAALAGLGAAASATAIATNSIKKAMDFESELSTIQALTGATSAEMADMQKLALKMGADTKYSALEAAQGIEELLKAGLTPATVKAGGLEAALNLATAGGLGLADSATIMSTALNAFSKDNMTAAHVADVLAGTANASATDVMDMRLSLSQASATAAGLGMSFDDVNVALGLFANKGIKGEAAGTALKTMLSYLQPTTASTTRLFKALKITTDGGADSFFNAAGNIKPLVEVSGLLRNKLSKLNNQQRQLALTTIFGQDANKAANILYEAGAKGVENFYTQMKDVTALDVARRKMDNAAGSVEQFRGAIETLQISALMPTMPLIKGAFNKLSQIVEKYTPQITASMQKAVDSAKGYLKDHFINNSEFTKLPDIKSKIAFVFDDIGATFQTWYDASGRAKTESIAASLVTTMAGALKASTPLLDAATTIGLSLGKSLISGFWQAIADDPKLAAILGGAGGATVGSAFGPLGILIGGVGGAAAAGGASAIHSTSPYVKAEQSSKAMYDLAMSMDDFHAKYGKDTPYISGATMGPLPGHASGLDRVPYNGYVARLHKDEEVLTKTEASEYRDQRARKGNKSGVNITVQSMVVRKESDIDDIARKLVGYIAY